MAEQLTPEERERFEAFLKRALATPLPRSPRRRRRPAWLDGVPFALAVVGLLFVGAVGISIAMGWIR